MGTVVRTVLHLAASQGWEVRAVSLDKDAHSSLPLPCLRLSYFSLLCLPSFSSWFRVCGAANPGYTGVGTLDIRLCFTASHRRKETNRKQGKQRSETPIQGLAHKRQQRPQWRCVLWGRCGWHSGSKPCRVPSTFVSGLRSLLCSSRTSQWLIGVARLALPLTHSVASHRNSTIFLGPFGGSVFVIRASKAFCSVQMLVTEGGRESPGKMTSRSF